MTLATVVRCYDSLTGDDGMTDLTVLHSRGDLKATGTGISAGLSECAQAPLVDRDSFVQYGNDSYRDDSVIQNLVGCSHSDFGLP